MFIQKEFVFGFACTALGFRRKVLRCLIALGRKGRLCLCGLPDVGLMSRPFCFVLLPLGACLPTDVGLCCLVSGRSLLSRLRILLLISGGKTSCLVVLLPLGARFTFCRTYVTCLLLKDFLCVAVVSAWCSKLLLLSCSPRCILAVLVAPLGVCFAFCRTYVICLLLKDFFVWC